MKILYDELRQALYTTIVNYSIHVGTVTRTNERISRTLGVEHRCKHCRVSSLVMVCRRSFAAKANLFAIETALLTRRQQSADHNRDKVCRVGVTVNTE